MGGISSTSEIWRWISMTGGGQHRFKMTKITSPDHPKENEAIRKTPRSGRRRSRGEVEYQIHVVLRGHRPPTLQPEDYRGTYN